MHRVAHESLRRTNVNTAATHAAQEYAALDLALNVLAEPERWNQHARRTISSALLAHTYGVPGRSESALRFMSSVYNFMRRTISSASPGEWAVDFFPWLTVLPSWCATWKAWAAGHYADSDAEFLDMAGVGSSEEVRRFSAPSLLPIADCRLHSRRPRAHLRRLYRRPSCRSGTLRAS